MYPRRWTVTELQGVKDENEQKWIDYISVTIDRRQLKVASRIGFMDTFFLFFQKNSGNSFSKWRNQNHVPELKVGDQWNLVSGGFETCWEGIWNKICEFREKWKKCNTYATNENCRRSTKLGGCCWVVCLMNPTKFYLNRLKNKRKQKNASYLWKQRKLS